MDLACFVDIEEQEPRDDCQVSESLDKQSEQNENNEVALNSSPADAEGGGDSLEGTEGPWGCGCPVEGVDEGREEDQQSGEGDEVEDRASYEESEYEDWIPYGEELQENWDYFAEFANNALDNAGGGLSTDEMNFALSSMQVELKAIEDGLLSCCPICKEDFKPGECVEKTVCNHTFHDNCLRPWLENNKICPYCTEEVISESDRFIAANLSDVAMLEFLSSLLA